MTTKTDDRIRALEARIDTLEAALRQNPPGVRLAEMDRVWKERLAALDTRLALVADLAAATLRAVVERHTGAGDRMSWLSVAGLSLATYLDTTGPSASDSVAAAVAGSGGEDAE